MTTNTNDEDAASEEMDFDRSMLYVGPTQEIVVKSSVEVGRRVESGSIY